VSECFRDAECSLSKADAACDLQVRRESPREVQRERKRDVCVCVCVWEGESVSGREGERASLRPNRVVRSTSTCVSSPRIPCRYSCAVMPAV
jgi:hypothetical protein